MSRVDVAFMVPMPSELRPLVKAGGLTKTRERDMTVHRGSVRGVNLIARLIGVGPPRAAAETQRVLDAFDPRHVVVVGIAGGIEGRTELGDLVVPELVIDHETNTEYRQTVLGHTEPRGRIRTTDEFLTEAELLARFHAEHVYALDMETAAVAAVCEERGVPWSAFRAISDIAGDPNVNNDIFLLLNPDGSPNTRAVAKYLLRHPGKLPALKRLSDATNRAAKRAAVAALAAVARHEFDDE